MVATKQRTIRVSVDGGDFFPEDKVKSGISRLVKSFTENLVVRKKGSFIFFYYFFGRKGINIQSGPIIIRNLRKRYFSTLFLPVRIIFDRIDVHLAFSGVLPQFIRMFKKKSIVFIHDFAFYSSPDRYGDPDKMKWQTDYAIYGADKIIVFSEYIKNQLLKKFPNIPVDKVVRVYPGADHLPIPRHVQHIHGKYFLYVGVIKAAKNIEGLLKLFSEYLDSVEQKNLKLILIGKQEKTYFEKIQKLTEFKKIQNNLLFIESLTDSELVSYYINCMALINLSHEEGFCYPVVEALSLGKQVIVNKIPLYEEFLPYFNTLRISKDNKEFINIMKDISTLTSHSFSPVKSPFTWKRFTAQVLEIIQNTIT